MDHAMPISAVPLVKHYRVALLGFSEFERNTLGAYFRLSPDRERCYQQAPMLTDADFLVADAEHPPSVQLVLATDRLGETVFIGAPLPAGALAWMPRPIDPLQVLRELDALVQRAEAPSPSWLEPEGRPDDEWLIPSAPASASAPSPANPVQPLQAIIPVPAAPRALIVDDTDAAKRLLERRLQPWGLQTECASSSREAIESLERRNVDFVFLDVDLGPGSELDGLALCRQIKHTPGSMNAMVVFVSARHSELDRVRGALAGCDAYLAQPLDDQELARLLQRQGLKLAASAPA
jgi:CheY-like chemotaxis protein